MSWCIAEDFQRDIALEVFSHVQHGGSFFFLELPVVDNDPSLTQAMEKSLALLRSSPELVTTNLTSGMFHMSITRAPLVQSNTLTDGWHMGDLLCPIFMGPLAGINES